MASTTQSLACLKAVIDFALLLSSDSPVPELQGGDKEDLAAKLNSFRHYATAQDYSAALEYLWLRYDNLVSAIEIALSRFRELKAGLRPEQNVGAIKEAINRWDRFRPYERPVIQTKSKSRQQNEHRVEVIKAIVVGVIMFRLQSREKDQLLFFVSNFAQSMTHTKWDCDASDYILEIAA